jgi:hypothetical protein
MLGNNPRILKFAAHKLCPGSLQMLGAFSQKGLNAGKLNLHDTYTMIFETKMFGIFSRKA